MHAAALTAESNFLGNYVLKYDNLAWYAAVTIGTNTYLYIVIPVPYLIHMRQLLARHFYPYTSQNETLLKYQPHTYQHTYREVSVCTYVNLSGLMWQTDTTLWLFLKDIFITYIVPYRPQTAILTLCSLTEVPPSLFAFLVIIYCGFALRVMGSVRVIWSRFLDQLRQCSVCTTLHMRSDILTMLSLDFYTYIYMFWPTLCLKHWQRLRDHLIYRHRSSKEAFLFSQTSIYRYSLGEVCVSAYVDLRVPLGCLSSTLGMVLFVCPLGLNTYRLLLASIDLCLLTNMYGAARVFMCEGKQHYYRRFTGFHGLIFCSRGSVRAFRAHFLVQLRLCSLRPVLMVNYLWCIGYQGMVCAPKRMCTLWWSVSHYMYGITHFLLLFSGNVLVCFFGYRPRTIGDWLVIYQTHSKEAQVRL